MENLTRMSFTGAAEIPVQVNAEIPSEIQILPFGRHVTDKGAFVLDAEGMRRMVAAFDSKANDTVVDYEHQTLAGTQAPAAGWIKKLIDRGNDGLWASVEWTSKAADYLRNREYRYLSPVFLKRKGDDRVVALVNAALTNQPAIDGMVPVVNKDGLSSTAAVTQKEETAMDKVLEALGLKPGATEADALTALQVMKAELISVRKAVGLKPDAPASEVSGTLMAIVAKSGAYDELKPKVEALEAGQRRAKAEALVEQAMKDGKVTPAGKDDAITLAVKDYDAFSVYIAKAPVVVNTNAIAAGGVTAPSADAGEYAGMVCKGFGLTDAELKTEGKKGDR